MFGTAVAQKQAIAFRLTEMATEIDATRLLTWMAAWMIDSGTPAARDACLAHNYAADVVLKVTDNAVQVLGGMAIFVTIWSSCGCATDAVVQLLKDWQWLKRR